MSQRMWIRLMLMATVAVAVEEEKMPGIVIRISQKCLDHVSKQGTELLQKKLLKITLPIQMVVGEFELIRMMISKFMLRKSHIIMVSKGFILSMTDGSVVINGKWTNDRAKNNHIPFDLKLDGVIIKVSFNLGKNNKDLISVSVLECIICFDDINILTSTNQNFLRDMYKNYFQATLHNNMVQKIRRMIRILTTSYVEPYLHSMPVKVNMDGIAGIDYSLLQPPKFEDDHVDISLKGQFFGLTHYTLYSFPPSAVNFRSSQLQMVYFGVSHSFFIPQPPGLSKNFPSMTMKIIVNFPSSVPTIFIDSRTKLNLMSSLSTHVFAIFSNSSETPPFTLKLPQSGIETIIYRPFPALLQVLDLEENSKTVLFKVSLMQSPFTYYMSEVWLPKINERLEQGYPLPVLKTSTSLTILYILISQTLPLVTQDLIDQLSNVFCLDLGDSSRRNPTHILFHYFN